MFMLSEQNDEAAMPEVATPVPDAEAGALVSQGVLRAARDLGVTGNLLADIIGVSASSISRMRSGRHRIEHGSKSYELASLFIRVHQALSVIFRKDTEQMKGWMRTQNADLQDSPINHVKSVTGLVELVRFTEHHRRKLKSPVTQ